MKCGAVKTFGRVLALIASLSLCGCSEEVVEVKPVQENAVVGTWVYARKDRHDTFDMKMAFHSRGKFEQLRGQEALVGIWRIDADDVVVDHLWRKQPNGEELDLASTGMSTRYQVKMRGKALLLDMPGVGTLEFTKLKRNYGLFNSEVGIAAGVAPEPEAGEEGTGEGKKEEKKDESKAGH